VLFVSTKLLENTTVSTVAMAVKDSSDGLSGRTYSTPVDSTKIAKLTKTIVMLADTVDSRNASQKE